MILVIRTQGDEDIGVVTTPSVQQVFGRAVCGQVFDRYAEVWEEATKPTAAVPGQPLFSDAEYTRVVAAQDEWLAAVERAATAAPDALSSNGLAAVDVALAELAATKYSLDLLLSTATNPPNLVGAIRRTQSAAVELINTDPAAFADCDSARLQWPKT